MEPRIQYAKTSDGVSIAYWVLGKGMPLVYASSPPFNHLQMEWQIPQLRLLFERLARGRARALASSLHQLMPEEHVA